VVAVVGVCFVEDGRAWLWYEFADDEFWSIDPDLFRLRDPSASEYAVG